MKSAKLTLVALIIAAAGLFAFNSIKDGSVKGTVTPADAAARAWVISSTDTLKATVDKGVFEISSVKPGTYKLIIEAKPPYKNVSKEGITVADGQPTDVGEIKLEK